MKQINTKSDTNIDELLKTHGKRVKPHDLMKKAAYLQVKSHWRESLKKQKKQQNLFYMKIAATVMLVFSVLFTVQLSQKQSSFAIDSLYVKGDLSYSYDNITWKSNPKIEDLKPDTWLKTKAGTSVNLTLADNTQLRINQNSFLHLLNQDQIELIDGQLYYDADNANTENNMAIITDLGTIKHIGTRYMVNKLNASLQISVRNGLVELSNENGIQKLNSETQLEIDPSGNHSTKLISAYDPIWNWTQKAAQPFASQNQSLYDFINWYAHENGYQINWNRKKFKTKTVKLSGDLSQLSTNQQLKTVFLATTFNYEINQGILTIL